LTNRSPALGKTTDTQISKGNTVPPQWHVRTAPVIARDWVARHVCVKHHIYPELHHIQIEMDDYIYVYTREGGGRGDMMLICCQSCMPPYPEHVTLT
jgi:hypothetical protein